MKSLYLIAFFSLLSFSSSAQVIDKVVGIVGDKIVLKSDVEVQYQQYAAQTKTSLPSDFRCQLLDQLLVQNLMLGQAELDSVTVSEDDVDAELDKRIRYFINQVGSQEKLEEFYKKSVVEIKEEFRDDVRDQLVAQKMQSQITKNVKVTPGEVQEFFNSIPADSLPYYNAEVEVGQIVLYAKPSQKAKDEARDQLEKIRQEILDGDDFKLKAILYSDDPGSAKQGGELPEFTRNDPFAPEFIREAFRLEPGEISEPFETEFGFHILQVMDRKGERVKVRHILIQPDIKAADLDRTEEKVDSIRNLLIHEKITFGQAVGRFSEDDNTKQYAGFLTNPSTGESLMEIDQLGAMDRQIPFVIDTMNAGEYSSPQYYQDQRKNQGYRILYLKRVTKPHKANLDEDYARIQTAALSQKKQRVVREWVNERIKKTFIRIDDSYANCENLKPWRTANP